jgi:hypothetical protein
MIHLDWPRAQRRALRTLLLVALASIGLISPHFAFADETLPPAGVHAVSGGTASVAQGAASSSLVFELPPARGGVQPSLVLSYSSRDTAPREAGAGFSLALPAITRAPLSGAPSYADPGPSQTLASLARRVKADPAANEPALDRFVYNGSPLVPICTLWQGDCPFKGLPPWARGWHLFRLQQDSYTNFLWSPDGLTWRTIDSSGVIQEFGTPLIAPGAAPPAIDWDATSKRPFRWNLARRVDPLRDSVGRAVNVIVYLWDYAEAASPAGPIVLHDIYDTPANSSVIDDVTAYAHHTHLGWERQDIPWRMTPTWRASPAYRLRRVDVASYAWERARAREPVRRYHLSYDHVGTRSVLSTFAVEGRCDTRAVEIPEAVAAACPDSMPCGAARTTYVLPPTACPVLPPVRLAYSPEQMFVFGAPSSATAPDRTWATVAFPSELAPTDIADATVIDATSDGLPDVLFPSKAAKQAQRLFVNQGETFGTSRVALPLSDIGELAYPLNDGTEFFARTRSTTLLGAFSAFGLPSVVFDNHSNRNVSTADVIFSIVPDGANWKWTEGGAKALIAPFERAVDLNGDGLIDLRRSPLAPGRPADETTSVTYFSDRYWDGNILPSTNAVTQPSIEKACAEKATVADFADMDGDGLADYVVSGAGGIAYFPGNGNGAFGCASPRGDCKSQTVCGTNAPFGVPISLGRSRFTTPSQKSFFVGQAAFADVNGDGYSTMIPNCLFRVGLSTKRLPT